MRLTWLTVVLVAALVGCRRGEDPGTDPVVTGRGPHPWLLATPDDRDLVRSRIDREPYLTVLAALEAQADADWAEPDPEHWDHDAYGTNAEIGCANAFLAWLDDDPDRAEKAREAFAHLDTDYETHDTFDINIRMPHTLIGYTDTWDLLSATPWFPEAEADAAQAKITEINRKFFAQYLEDDFYRLVWLAPSQNNHPIRTASAIGYVGLAFPDDPDAEKWTDWAFSELDYLWGPDGQYVQADGGVSEGPFYFGFAWGVATATFIAADHVVAPDREFHRDCRNRQTVDPWSVTDCVDGETFTFANPLYDPRYHATVDWSLSLRLPWGSRPPLADAYFNPFNGGGLLTSFGGGGHTTWDWENNRDRPYEMGHGYDLVARHLVYLDDTVSLREPPWLTRFLPDAGNAVFRSDWSDDARWLLLVAEHGSARKTLHDHVDGSSFTLAAYGEYLLVDPGYYKPVDIDNAVTAQGDAHNLILIDGQGPPDKGLLTSFGDTDAFLVNTWDGTALDYAEAHIAYEDTDVERSVAMIDDRWFVVADRLRTDAAVAREHAWRLGGYAGLGSGGVFEVRADGARWERPLAGVDVFLGATAPGLEVREPEYTPDSRPHVHEFELDRSVTDHGVIDGAVTALAPRYLAVLAPYRVGDAPGSPDGPLDVTAVDAGPGATAWRVVTSAGTDLVLLRDAGGPIDVTVDGHVVHTDAELALARVSGGALALIGRGTTLSVDGAARIAAADPEAFAVAE